MGKIASKTSYDCDEHDIKNYHGRGDCAHNYDDEDNISAEQNDLDVTLWQLLTSVTCVNTILMMCKAFLFGKYRSL